MDELITATEAARILGISRQYFYDLVKNGTIPAIRIEPESQFKVKVSLKFRRSEIEDLLKKDRRVKVA